jgi:hypothetical protein
MDFLITFFEFARVSGMAVGGVLGIAFAGASLGVLVVWLLKICISVLSRAIDRHQKGGA